MSKILVIEDENAIRENIIEALELDGYEATGAENGLVGVETALNYSPDLIICDIMMPDLDGFGVLKQLRSEPKTSAIPFIFVSAKAERDSVRYGMEIGADDYLTKPFTPKELLAAVEARLSRHTVISKGNEQQVEQLKQQLMRMISDELRSPLVSINTVLEIISRQLGHLETTELQELLDTVGSGSKRLNRVVEQIGMITRLEMDGVTKDGLITNGVVWQLWEVLITATDLARRFAPERQNVYVRLEEHDKQVKVVCDPNMLKHALAEIISNALALSPKDGQIEVAQWRAEGGGVWISITDNGPGIPEDKIQHALTDFGQVNRETSEQQGLGLGLSLSRRVIEAHGGVLQVNSVVGQGTQVMVGLPTIEE